MDRNTVLALALSMMVFSGWVFWQSVRNPLPVEGEDSFVQETAPAPTPTAVAPPAPETNPSAWSEPLQPRRVDDGEATTPRPIASATPPPEPPPLAQTPDTPLWEHSFEMPLYHVRLSNRGASIRSWILTDPLYVEHTAEGTQP